MKYKNIITLALATLIISSASITLYYKMKPSPHLSLTCNSSLTYHADTFMVSSDISLTFHSNEKGVLFISGEIFNQENKLEINKRINFNYHHIDKNDYYIIVESDKDMYKNSVESDIFFKIFPSISKGSKKYLSIKNLDDRNIIIANKYAPIIICTKDELSD